MSLLEFCLQSASLALSESFILFLDSGFWLCALLAGTANFSWHEQSHNRDPHATCTKPFTPLPWSGIRWSKREGLSSASILYTAQESLASFLISHGKHSCNRLKPNRFQKQSLQSVVQCSSMQFVVQSKSICKIISTHNYYDSSVPHPYPYLSLIPQFCPGSSECPSGSKADRKSQWGTTSDPAECIAVSKLDWLSKKFQEHLKRQKCEIMRIHKE